MPADALPQPRTSLPGTARYRREYRDALGRPMTGKATFTGNTRHDDGELSVMVAPVTAPVTGGVIEVDLPPDTYTYTAELRTVDGHRVSDKGKFALGA